MKSDFGSAVASAAVKSAPPVGVSLGALAGAIDMTVLVGCATLLWLGLQSGYLLWKWYKEWRAGK